MTTATSASVATTPVATDETTALAQRYLDLFNTTDAERRRALAGELFVADGRYVDPNVDLSGPEEIDGFVAATQDMFPGWRFTLGTGPDAHHDQLRMTWLATAPGADAPGFVGFDVIVHDGGRIRHVLGFVDRTPA